jgi:hypothetical protein
VKHLLSKISIVSLIVSVFLLIASFIIPNAPAQAADATPECWGVFVGVANYQYLPDLRFSNADASDLYLKLNAVWDTNHTKLLVDSQAKKANILLAIEWLANRAGPEDTVLFSFSGYGSYIGLFHPYDSTGVGSSNAISPEELASAFQSVKAGKIIFILDFGAAGTFRQALAGPGRVVIMSSGISEITYSITSLQHSVFIYYWLEAFSHFDAVDTNHDYQLSAEELFAYASPRTTAYEAEDTTDFPSVQHPLIDDGVSGDLPLIVKFNFSLDANFPSGTTILTLDGVSYKATFAPLYWVPGRAHTMTVPQAIMTGNGTRYAFAGWNDGETSNTRVVSNGAFTARYNKEYLLTINSAYGNPTGAGWYQSGITANFTVTSLVIAADSKHHFTGWSGNYTGSSDSGSIVMNAPVTITANWRHEFLLTINSAYGAPVGAGWYNEGATANISIDPAQGFIVRHFFTGWSGDISDKSANAVVNMTSPKVITTNWETDYVQAYILISIIVLVVGGGAIAVIILLRRRNKKPIVKQEPIPDNIPQPPPASVSKQKPKIKPRKKSTKKPKQ